MCLAELSKEKARIEQQSKDQNTLVSELKEKISVLEQTIKVTQQGHDNFKTKSEKLEKAVKDRDTRIGELENKIKSSEDRNTHSSPQSTEIKQQSPSIVVTNTTTPHPTTQSSNANNTTNNQNNKPQAMTDTASGSQTKGTRLIRINSFKSLDDMFKAALTKSTTSSIYSNTTTSSTTTTPTSIYGNLSLNAKTQVETKRDNKRIDSQTANNMRLERELEDVVFSTVRSPSKPKSS